MTRLLPLEPDYEAQEDPDEREQHVMHEELKVRSTTIRSGTKVTNGSDWQHVLFEDARLMVFEYQKDRRVRRSPLGYLSIVKVEFS